MNQGEAFRARARQGERLTGLWLSLGLGVAAEMAALCGYDWALIDREHGPSDDRDLLSQLWALQAGSTAAVVRVSGLLREEIKRTLDLAPEGIMIPDIQTAEQAQMAVEFVRTPPQGTRGTATTTRAAGYGYWKDADRSADVMLVAQIESAAGVNNVEAIAAIRGIDGLFAGPHDLAVSLKASGDTRSLDECLVRIAEVARKSGKFAGIVARTPEDAAQRASIGYTLVSCGSDRGTLAAGLRSNAERLSSAFANKVHTPTGAQGGD